jgi:hypothetical protein
MDILNINSKYFLILLVILYFAQKIGFLMNKRVLSTSFKYLVESVDFRILNSKKDA